LHRTFYFYHVIYKNIIYHYKNAKILCSSFFNFSIYIYWKIKKRNIISLYFYNDFRLNLVSKNTSLIPGRYYQGDNTPSFIHAWECGSSMKAKRSLTVTKFDALLVGINKGKLHSMLVIAFTADKRMSVHCVRYVTIA